MHEKSIELLNKAIAEELTAVHQYLYFHFQCNDQGLGLLTGLFRKVSISEMLHIEKLSLRVLFLNGDLKLAVSRPVESITDPRLMVERACQMEQEAILSYNKWAREAADVPDSVTKKIFEDLVLEEEDHFDDFDQEMGNIERYGDNYLALQSIERSKERSAGPTAQ